MGTSRPFSNVSRAVNSSAISNCVAGFLGNQIASQINHLRQNSQAQTARRSRAFHSRGFAEENITDKADGPDTETP